MKVERDGTCIQVEAGRWLFGFFPFHWPVADAADVREKTGGRSMGNRADSDRTVPAMTFARFEARCADLNPGFSVTESALAAETASLLAFYALLHALNQLQEPR